MNTVNIVVREKNIVISIYIEKVKISNHLFYLLPLETKNRKIKNTKPKASRQKKK